MQSGAPATGGSGSNGAGSAFDATGRDSVSLESNALFVASDTRSVDSDAFDVNRAVVVAHDSDRPVTTNRAAAHFTSIEVGKLHPLRGRPSNVVRRTESFASETDPFGLPTSDKVCDGLRDDGERGRGVGKLFGRRTR
jgi:hypothetical protein